MAATTPSGRPEARPPSPQGPSGEGRRLILNFSASMNTDLGFDAAKLSHAHLTANHLRVEPACSEDDEGERQAE